MHWLRLSVLKEKGISPHCSVVLSVPLYFSAPWGVQFCLPSNTGGRRMWVLYAAVLTWAWQSWTSHPSTEDKDAEILTKKPLNTKVFKQRTLLIALCIQSPLVDPAGSVKRSVEKLNISCTLTDPHSLTQWSLRWNLPGYLKEKEEIGLGIIFCENTIQIPNPVFNWENMLLLNNWYHFMEAYFLCLKGNSIKWTSILEHCSFLSLMKQ